MAIISFATSAASTTASYAFTAATSYLRSDPASLSDSKENVPPPPLSPHSPLDPTTPASPSARKLQRHNSSARRIPSYHASASTAARGTPPDGSSSASAPPHPKRRAARGDGEDLVDQINQTDELYEILGIGKRAKSEEIRRGFLARSRICHPDKLPDYAPSTTAFQRLSYAYETLSKPGSRRIYDLGGMRSFEPGPSASATADGATADETLNGVLRGVINEFLNGDFEMIRVFVTALNDGSPGLNLGDEAIDNLESAFRKAREVLLAGQRYALLLKFSLIRMYEIQLSLRRLSYFNVYGRLRLTMELMRCMVEVPLILDKAMREDSSPSSPTAPSPSTASPSPESSSHAKSCSEAHLDEPRRSTSGQGQQLERRGMLGVRTKGLLVLTCKVLERAERWSGGSTSTSSPSATWDERDPDPSVGQTARSDIPDARETNPTR
ncbi:hypothetical protein JCM11491_003012 [Sporobolomyces phaffii]